MNVLFIEDEKELAVMGAAQLELKGFDVFIASDLAQARVILDDPERTVHFVITDHRLPDGLGVEFVIGIQGTFSVGKCAVVSGCLTSREIEKLEAHDIPYYHKPLLYGSVIDDLRRKHAAKAAVYVKPEPPVAPEAKEPASVLVEPAKRKSFKIWPFRG